MSGVTNVGPQPRRLTLRHQEQLNGIDYVEGGDDRRTLKVVLFRPPPEQLLPQNFAITGGVRVRNPTVHEIRLIEPSDPDIERSVRLVFAQPGDASIYRLQMRDVAGFDPRYARIDFTFGDNVDQRLDCVPPPAIPDPPPPSPEFDYLAKDYAGFRRLAFDRLAQTMTTWTETHVPDVAVMLVEMMAYVGDQLSYYQDTVATEAYLGTARLRTSIRRHARLIDYTMDEGCNSRVWVQVTTSNDLPLEPSDIRFAVGYADPPVAEFAPIGTDKIILYANLNEIAFSAWGDGDNWLPRGSTSATLRDVWIDHDARGPRKLDGLQVGHTLLIETVAIVDSKAEPDPTQRCTVRLTHVTRLVDPLYDIPVVEIRWADEDALPFATALPPPPGDLPPGTRAAEIIAIARGNMILADHGRLVVDEIVPARRHPTADRPSAFALGPRRPRLRERGLTFREPVDPNAPASLAVIQTSYRAAPQVLSLVRSGPDADAQGEQPVSWSAHPDLIGSGPEDFHFVVEMDDDGVAVLRFGDNERGMHPGEDALRITYRVGNGPAGNIGAETIMRVLNRNDVAVAGLTPRNPLPAVGGTAPEKVADVKLLAPQVFRARRERAVTADDYAAAAEEIFGVRRAAADLMQLGAIRLVRVAIIPLFGNNPSPDLIAQVHAHLDSRRRIGHDVQVVAAQMVALDIGIVVGVFGTYLRGHVLAALREALGASTQRDGRPGLFRHDQMSFGTPVHASRIVAAAQTVTGVEWVRLTRLRRLQDAAPEDRQQLAHDAVTLALDRFEVARMDNDSTHPEHGRLAITLQGGR